MVLLDRLILMEDMRLHRDALQDEELLESIRQYGIRDSLLARPHPDETLKAQGKLQIVDGRRRYRNARILGILEIPVEIREMDDLEAYTMAMVRNIQRADVDDEGVAHWLNLMQIKFNLKQQDLAKRMNRSQTWISRHLSLWEEIEAARRQMRAAPETERQARALRGAPEEIKETIHAQTELPPAREIERLSKATIPSEELLKKFSQSTHDEEYVAHKLQEESGLSPSEARDTASKWRRTMLSWQRAGLERSESGRAPWEPRKNDPMMAMYAELSKYYPPEVIDAVGSVAPAKTLQTWISNCRRFLSRLYERMPLELRQTVLEEFRI